MRRHIVDVIVVQAQLLSDLLVRQVQPHEIQTQDPGPKRLMVSGQNSPAQVIEPRSAVLTPVPLPMSLGFIMAMADHGGAGTARAANAVRPSIVPDQPGQSGEAYKVLSQDRRHTVGYVARRSVLLSKSRLMNRST